MNEFSQHFLHNQVGQCKLAEKLMFARDVKPPELAAFVEVGCQLNDRSGSEASETDDYDQVPAKMQIWIDICKYCTICKQYLICNYCSICKQCFICKFCSFDKYVLLSDKFMTLKIQILLNAL